ncbi:hypothetical protein AB835_12920 [Candidatus Endobugula sertula]|uniref:Uncharacterized protein n=1 Tax=Candidatus Endobugula sertula TaxID=62101 RepID=A0A1D2QM76_9GAMM|nr:hypothetical protein AB835_12920 [Candidatus Endobugula sertula]
MIPPKNEISTVFVPGSADPTETPPIQNSSVSSVQPSSSKPIGHRSVHETSVAVSSMSLNEKPETDSLKEQLNQALLLYRHLGQEGGSGGAESQSTFTGSTFCQKTQEDTFQALKERVCNLEQLNKSNPQIRANLLLSQAALALKLEDKKTYDEVVARLCDEFEAELPNLIEILKLHHQCALDSSLLKDEEKLHYFLALAGRTHFIPSIWLFIREALKPESLLSPVMILDELTSFTLSPLRSNTALCAFALHSDDVFVVTKKSHPNEQSAYHQALWVFFSVFSNTREEFKECPRGQPNSFSATLQKAMHLSFMQVVAEAIEHVMAEKVNNFKILPLLKRSTRTKIQNYLKSRFGVDTLFEALKNNDLDVYQRAVAGLILAWVNRETFFLRSGKPLSCAYTLMEVAKVSGFKMVYRDAARLFARFGHFDEAVDCLNKLTRMPSRNSLHDSQLAIINNLLESYTQAQEATSQKVDVNPNENEWLIGTSAITHQNAKPQTSRPGKRKKGKYKSHPSQEIVGDKATRQGKSGHQQADTPSASKGVSAPDKSSAKQYDGASADTIRAVSSTRPKQQRSAVLYPPEGGWLPDGNPVVSWFYRELRSIHSECDLKKEAECISTWLKNNKGKDVYGRICEQAAWFYIRQMECPFPGLYSLEDDELDTRAGLPVLAGQWLSRAEACYFMTERPEKADPDELKEQIESFYNEHPDLHKNPEYCKRIRSICSSWGHICSNRVAGLAGRCSRGSYQQLKEDSNKFYQLKFVADPNYTQKGPVTIEPSVHVISEK